MNASKITLIIAMVAAGGCSDGRTTSGTRSWSHSAPVRWTPEGISTPGYESSAVFTQDGREMYFMRADRSFDNYRIYQASCTRNRWSVPLEPSFAAGPGVYDADPFLSHDDSKLYFVSTRHRFNQVKNEDFDIYLAERNNNGGWGEATRLPEPINSKGSELLPRASRSGMLYFGSSREGGRGGSDIYSASKAASGKWKVMNLVDVNTSANDYEADISPDGRRLAVVSDREGKSRIYLYEKVGQQWSPRGKIKADAAVFQVGPRWSPDGKRLSFSQDAGEDSGEIFWVQISPGADRRWPPVCGQVNSRRAGTLTQEE